MARRAARSLGNVVSPGQAQYVLDRLVEEKRVAPGEVRRYLSDLGDEIARLEARLRALRAALDDAPQQRARAQRSGRPSPPAAGSRRVGRRRRNQLQGSYMGYMRQVRDEGKKARFRALKDTKGYESAIAAIREHLGK